MTARSGAMGGRVRPFVAADIPQVTELHRMVFDTPASAPASYQRYFSDVFLANPWSTAAVPSRVHVEADGRITGFLGVVPRRMRMNGRPLLAAICSQFIVHPASRGVVGLKLLKDVFEGPQDLSLTDEANEATRTIWEGRGGVTVWPHSVGWLRPLRPARLAASWLKQRRGLSPMAMLSVPLALLVEALAQRLVRRAFPHEAPDASGDDLGAATVIGHLPRFASERIHPDYDAESLAWLLGRAERMHRGRQVVSMVVSSSRRGVLGWYLYVVNADGIGEVAQIAGTIDTVDAVLAHLVNHAWRCGLLALSGRLEPAFMRHFLAHGFILHSRSRYMLVHSKIPAVTQAVQDGRILLTPLDGEWSLRFHAA